MRWRGNVVWWRGKSVNREAHVACCMSPHMNEEVGAAPPDISQRCVGYWRTAQPSPLERDVKWGIRRLIVQSGGRKWALVAEPQRLGIPSSLNGTRGHGNPARLLAPCPACLDD